MENESSSRILTFQKFRAQDSCDSDPLKCVDSDSNEYGQRENVMTGRGPCDDNLSGAELV